MLKKILRLLIENIKVNYIKYIKYIIINNKTSSFDLAKEQKKVIVFQTPISGNLGDQAIGYAQKNFLETYYSDYLYYEIPMNKVIENAKSIRSQISNQDILFVNGGGNIGDEYFNEEYTRRFIIKYFSDNKIISFPQTIHFSNSKFGRKFFNDSKKIYNENNNFNLVARESKSFEIMKRNFESKNILFTPDIVLSLDKRKNNKRDGVIISLRNDIEGKLDKKFKKDLIELLNKKFSNITNYDTDIGRKINIEDREDALNNIWECFSSSELVITDRLHGMIFCAITGTPCLVFKNYNHKIEFSYNNWLKKLTNIKFIETPNDLEEIDLIIEELRSEKADDEFYQWIIEKFNPLFNCINNIEKLNGEYLNQKVNR